MDLNALSDNIYVVVGAACLVVALLVLLLLLIRQRRTKSGAAESPAAPADGVGSPAVARPANA